MGFTFAKQSATLTLSLRSGNPYEGNPPLFNIAPAGSTFDAEKKCAPRIDKHIVLDTCVLHREVLGYVFAVFALASAVAADSF